MLSPDISIIDYQIVPAKDVKQYLETGFTLYGPPMSCSSILSQSETPWFYQALIKTSDTNNKKMSMECTQCFLNQIEHRCVLLLAEGKTTEEIATLVHRARGTIRNILAELRYRFRCKTNAQLILVLERGGLLSSCDHDF